MCKGVANFAQAPPDDFDNGFNWFDAIDDVLAEDDEEFGFELAENRGRAKGTTDAGVAVPSGKGICSFWIRMMLIAPVQPSRNHADAPRWLEPK